MGLAPSGRRAHAPQGLASLLLSLAAMGCPGPEPATVSGEGGGSASTSGATTSASSGETTGVSSSESTGVGGATNVGGAGGGGSTATGGGGSAPAGTGGHGGAGGAGGAGGCDAVLESDPENCGACGRACSDLEAAELECVGGRCVPTCKDGFSSVTSPEAPENDDGCETAWRRVFVTLEPQVLPLEVDDPGVVGAEAADAICQALAINLGGTWRAWISDGLSPPPSERFTPHAVPYWLLDETVIAASFDDVIDGALDAPIHVTEGGASLFDLFSEAESFPVWTATDENGEATGEDCSDWMPAAGQALAGQVGLVADYEAVGLDATSWTRIATLRSCFSEGVRLYCFEQ